MVTKPITLNRAFNSCLILAKIYMVTKLMIDEDTKVEGLILAKIYMVTKLIIHIHSSNHCLILAKIYMVTKPQIHNSIYLKTNKS